MSRRRRGRGPSPPGADAGSDEPGSFSELARGLGDIEPLPPAPARAEPPARPAPSAEQRGRPRPRSRWRRPDPGEPLLGCDESIDPELWRALQRGELRPETRIDLHGLERDTARRRLGDQLRTAAGVGARCVLVVHGRGLRSPGGRALLREALPGWLATRGLRELVLACAPARPRDGGAGATYVLLR